MAPEIGMEKTLADFHTGTGKYQKGGVYSMNGERFNKIPNYKFKKDVLVKYIGTHKDFINKVGKVVSKCGDKHRSSRSIIKVKLEDGRLCIFSKII